MFDSQNATISGADDVFFSNPATGQLLTYDAASAKWKNIALPDATSTVKGGVRLTGDLGGTAASPTVPGLAAKAPLASPTFTGTVTVPTPTNTTDATTKAYVDTQVTTAVPDATTTVKGKLQLAGDLAGTAASPSVAKINGIAVSGTPSTGQILTATSPTAATWQTGATGSSNTYTAKHSMSGGRSLTSTGLVIAGGPIYPPNWINTLRSFHTATAAMSDVRLVYRGSGGIEADFPNTNNIKVGFEYPTGTITPVTFNGKQVAQLDPNGVITSDPIPVDIAAGSSFWVRTCCSAPSGNYTTVTTAIGVGVTSFQVAALPGVTAGTFWLGSGGTREAVTVTNITGTANPYTVTLSTATINAHAVGDLFGQGFGSSRYGYGDVGEGSVNSDASYSGTIGVPSAMTTTLAQAATAGDTTIKVASTSFLSPTMTIGSETVTIKNVIGTANPYTAYLTSALANSYASGTTVTASYGLTQGVCPTAIVSDSTSGAVPRSVIVLGDSICQGVGYYLRSSSSFVVTAFAGVRPFINTSVAGEAVFQFVNYATSRRRRQLLSLFDWVFYEYGVNDVYSGQTLAQVQANATAVLMMAKNRGLKIAMTTLTPRTTSTDSWMTTGNQTIAATGFNAVRLSYNAWVRAGAGGLADLVVELADVVETARDSGIWKVDSSNGPYTVDGIHPSYTGHNLMAAAIPVASFV